MAYYVVSIEDIESPVEEGLYEFDGEEYTLSEDEYPDLEKTYYDYEEEETEEDLDEYEEIEIDVGEPLDEGVYELVGNEYVVTLDAVAEAGKTYYAYTGYVYNKPYDIDSMYHMEPEPEGNPAEQGLYELLSDGSYALTEDIEVVDEKVYYRKFTGNEHDDVYTPAAPDENPSIEGFYERLSDGTYVLTEDVTIVGGKVYYERSGVNPEIEETSGEPFFPLDNIPFDGKSESDEAGVAASSLPMVYARTAFVDDPSAAGFYEIVDGVYVLTADTELVEGKVYYETYFYTDYYAADMYGVANPSFSIYKYYELVNDEYVPTSDSVVDPNKTYYRSREDDNNFFVLDPVDSE